MGLRKMQTPEQIVNLLRQVDVAVASFKMTAKATTEALLHV
jgi:hypothetical protein